MHVGCEVYPAFHDSSDWSWHLSRAIGSGRCWSANPRTSFEDSESVEARDLLARVPFFFLFFPFSSCLGASTAVPKYRGTTRRSGYLGYSVSGPCAVMPRCHAAHNAIRPELPNLARASARPSGRQSANGIAVPDVALASRSGSRRLRPTVSSCHLPPAQDTSGYLPCARRQSRPPVLSHSHIAH